VPHIEPTLVIIAWLAGDSSAQASYLMPRLKPTLAVMTGLKALADQAMSHASVF